MGIVLYVQKRQPKKSKVPEGLVQVQPAQNYVFQAWKKQNLIIKTPPMACDFLFFAGGAQNDRWYPGEYVNEMGNSICYPQVRGFFVDQLSAA